jgi:hypothetical protein
MQGGIDGKNGDRWLSRPIACMGGLILNTDVLTQGTALVGSAKILQNFEPGLEGGYRRISGYTKFDSATVNAATNKPVQGVKVYNLGVLAVRQNSGGTDNEVFFSTGSGWSKVSSTTRGGNPVKARFITYSITQPVAILVDGVNRAWKWNGSAETTINGTGAPTNPKYAVMFKNRLILGGYGDGSRASLSAPNADTDFDGSNGAVEINIGDTLTGFGIFREQCVFFCKNSIRKLVGSTASDFAVVPVSSFIGCVSQDSIQEIGGDLIYFANDGIRSYAATERNDDVELGLVSQAIQPLTGAVLAKSLTENQYSSCSIRKKNQYRLFFYDLSLPEADANGFLGRFQDTPVTPQGQYEWATLKGIKAYCSDSGYAGNQEIAVFGHGDNGYVYRLESGNTFDGANIIAIFRSPDLTFDEATLRKVFHKIDIITQVEGDVNAEVKLILDREAAGTIQPTGQSLVQTGSVPIYGSAIYGTSTYGTFVYPMFKRNLVGSGFFGTFQFICNDDSAPFRIDSYQVQFSVKGRR